MDTEQSNRLVRIERTLEELDQRQRISRLDTVILLLHPILLAGIAALIALPYSSLVNIEFFGLKGGYILLVASVGLFFACGIVWGFVRYILSYLTNDVASRVRSCRKLAWGAIGMTFQLAIVLVGVPSSLWIGAHFSNDVLTAFTAFWTIMVFVLVHAWSGLVSKSSERIVFWIENNVPRCLGGTGLSSSMYALEARSHFRRIKMSMSLGCMIGMYEVIWAWFQGVRELGFLLLSLLLLGFVALTVLAWWQSRR